MYILEESSIFMYPTYRDSTGTGFQTNNKEF